MLHHFHLVGVALPQVKWSIELMPAPRRRLRPATLVVGSTDAHFLMVASSTTVREDCVFATGASGGPSLAFCKTFSADPTFTTTVAVVETAIPKDVQVPSESVDGGRSGQVFTGLLTWAQAILRSTGLNV